MSWMSEWQAVSSRIKGLLDAGIFFYTSQGLSSADDRSVRKKNPFKNSNGNKTRFRQLQQKSF